MARDHLIHAGENTARAREVAEYFQQKISAVLPGQFLQYPWPHSCDVLGDLGGRGRGPCETINQAESFNRPGDA
jgi:hypothetical protein